MGTTPDNSHSSGLNPATLSVGDAAKLLSKVGGVPVSREMIDVDIASGAPTNADGTLHLVMYAAWLVNRTLREGDRNGQ
ncbi:MAG TPA: hypothetical protein VFW73_01065 [Lacipirellulaceae bacterium]|nr:hypothetical protein [Lacipirellulaceae bacterium]